MKVKELIAQLKKFNPELEVTITDGYEHATYSTNHVEVAEFEDIDGSISLDIGIGGNRMRHKTLDKVSKT